MTRTFRLSVIMALCLVVLTLSAIPAMAQIGHVPPNYCCGPQYTFGQAKAHTHSTTSVVYGFYEINGLVYDPTNNGGNAFLGNTIKIRGWGSGTTYWYDWSTDPLAVTKLSVWGNSYGRWDVITAEYDPDCMLITKLTSVRFP